ncbi:hypothetical protein [Halobaculum gomorrense]|uniref:Uncharacterized protein n=1 Tax=Halobaculum gomorrense TaxID=43928 RepID=A0A1M5SFJ2_9EURY|nr:hypothetical protein [Halobaculum gomorrense]SHH37200.1 hypothetical protein SAMN05443636_2444 [Halobaculum gomorrense]
MSVPVLVAVDAVAVAVAPNAQLPAFQLLTVVLAFVGAGVALAAGVGLVAVYVRLGDGVDAAVTRRAFGLWAAGALLLAAGTPAVFRASLSAAPTLRALALVAVAVGALAVGAAPMYLWQATLSDA